MTFDEARERLRFHDGSHPDVGNPQWEQGFLQSLRPYRGLERFSLDCSDGFVHSGRQEGNEDEDIFQGPAGAGRGRVR